MTFRELRVPGWFVATISIAAGLVAAGWRAGTAMQNLLAEHRTHTAIMVRVERRLCRLEAKTLGEPDVNCVPFVQH